MATAARAPAGSSVARQMTPQPPPTITQTQARQAVLHLRGAPRVHESSDGAESTSTRRRIQWAEDVIDNEGLGRKKSKVCCIYHAPRGIDESSDESSSSGSDDSDESGDDGSARPAGGKKACGHAGHGHGHGHGGKGKGKENKRSTSPNAYERIPKVKGAGAAKEK